VRSVTGVSAAGCACRLVPRRPEQPPLLGCAQLVAALRASLLGAGTSEQATRVFSERASRGSHLRAFLVRHYFVDRRALVPRTTEMARPPGRAFLVLRCGNESDQRTIESPSRRGVQNCAAPATVTESVTVSDSATGADRVPVTVPADNGT
jgi:hypothetical protein